jgi:hypothetical protein
MIPPLARMHDEPKPPSGHSVEPPARGTPSASHRQTGDLEAPLAALDAATRRARGGAVATEPRIEIVGPALTDRFLS